MFALELGQPIIDRREVTESSHVRADRVVDSSRETASSDQFSKLLQTLSVECKGDLLARHKGMIVLSYDQSRREEDSGRSPLLSSGRTEQNRRSGSLPRLRITSL